MTHPDEYIDLQEDFNELLGWYREDEKKIVTLQATADRRLELLREFEWSHYDTKHDDMYCYICDANKKEGHKDGCRLAKELSDAR